MSARETPVDCVVIGGGFTGLAAAHTLVEQGRSVTVLEREQSLGGLGGGFSVDGHELERFYHHWFTSDRHIMELAERVGVADRITTRPTRTGMYYAGSAFRLSTPSDLLKFHPISLKDRIRTGLATLAVRKIKDWRPLEGMTAKEWLVRWFGRDVYRVIWEPLLVGKFGRYADEISAVWIWNKLALRGGSRGKGGAEELSYFRGGFAALARAVGDKVTSLGGSVRLNTQVRTLNRRDDGVIEVVTPGATLLARNVLITTPLSDAAGILEAAASPAYIAKLSRIQYLGNVCLILVLDRSLSSLYWTNVNDPSFPFVGIIEHTNFEPTSSYGGRHIIYMSKYLPVDDPLYGMNAEAAYAYAEPHIKRMFPEFDSSCVHEKYVWRAPYAQPIVEKDYSSLIPPFETPIPGVFLATMAQVYPEDRGTNYAVREGRIAAAKIDERLSSGHYEPAEASLAQS